MRQGIVGGMMGAIVALGISLLAQSWTTPRTWVTGEVVSAGQLNTHVRDNLTYLYNALTSLDASDTISGLFNTARLGTGTASGSTYLHGDQTWGALDAAHLTAGTVPTARLPANVLVDLVSGWTGTQVSSISSTWTATGLSTTITIDDATNDVEIAVWQQMGFARGSVNCQIRLLEGTTVLWTSGTISSGSSTYHFRRRHQRRTLPSDRGPRPTRRSFGGPAPLGLTTPVA